MFYVTVLCGLKHVLSLRCHSGITKFYIILHNNKIYKISQNDFDMVSHLLAM